jgi:hypothetical protein
MRASSSPTSRPNRGAGLQPARGGVQPSDADVRLTHPPLKTRGMTRQFVELECVVCRGLGRMYMLTPHSMARMDPICAMRLSIWRHNRTVETTWGIHVSCMSPALRQTLELDHANGRRHEETYV